MDNKTGKHTASRPEPLFELAESVEDKILRRVPKDIFLLALLLSIPALLLFDPVSALLFFAGGILAAVNFIWVRKEIPKALHGSKKRAIRPLLALYVLRVVLILGIFLIIIFFFSKKVLALAAGFSTIVPVVLAEAAFALSRSKRWKN